MRRFIEKILVLLLITVLAITWLGINFSYAAEPTISVSSATVGKDFTVTITMPTGTVVCTGEIEIVFSDKSTVKANINKLTGGMDADYENIDNVTYTFNAAKEGEATVNVTKLACSSKDAEKLNGSSTLIKTFTVASNTPPPSTPSTPSNSETPPTPSTPTTPTEPEKPTTSNEPTWRETGDTVYALEDLNVRSGWGTSYNKIGSLAKNSSTKRIAVGSNGWDKINYNGSTGYVMSKYLTTEKPGEEEKPDDDKENEPTWRETGDTVYALQKLNVRSGWGTSYKAIGSLKKHESVKRIAVGSNGWDKIDYSGTTAYVMSKYLTTEKPEEKETNTAQNEVENSVDNNTVENANVITNEEMYNKILEEVGVIPAVGKSIVDYIYVIAVTISIAIVAFIGIKIRENNKE